MAQTTTVRDWRGKIIGFVDFDKSGKKTVRNFHGQILGYYDPQFNVTRRFGGQVIAKGDQSSMLFGLYGDNK